MNVIWFSAHTLAKLGYGDYVPVTIPGRILAVIIIMTGTLYISVGFVMLTNAIELSAHEKKALSLIETVDTEKRIQNSAAKIISLLMKIRVLTKNENDETTKSTKSKIDVFVNSLKIEIISFRRLRKFD